MHNWMQARDNILPWYVVVVGLVAAQRVLFFVNKFRCHYKTSTTYRKGDSLVFVEWALNKTSLEI